MTGPGPQMYYVVQFRTTDRSLNDAARSDAELISAHMAHSTDMHTRGDLLVAGAFLDESDSQELHTMAVTTTREAADAYVAGDRSSPPARSLNTASGAGQTSSQRRAGDRTVRGPGATHPSWSRRSPDYEGTEGLITHPSGRSAALRHAPGASEPWNR
jgi:uncharacterized protein YciI